MNDLPMVLDDPLTRGRGAGSPRSATLARTSATNDIPWPWWMAPARIVGRIRPGVRAAAAADAIALRRFPGILVAVLPPLVILVVAAIVSISHASTSLPHPTPRIEWLRLTIDVVYTESALFLLIAVIIGSFSPAIGALLVAIFGVTDILASIPFGYELKPFPAALVGRLIAIWLLWLLVVEIPTFGRMLGLSWRRLAGNRWAVAALTGLATGAFIWAWTQAATVLIRPIFTWSSLPSGVTLEAIRPVQTAGLVFAVAGGLVAALGAAWRGPAGQMFEGVAQPARPNVGAVAIATSFVRRVLGAALLTLSLAGLISWPLEAVVLVAVFLGAGPLARFVADRTPLGSIVGALPPVVRYAVAAALVFGVAQVTVAPLFRFAAFDSTGKVPEFFSVIAAVAIGIILVELATTPGTPRRSSTTVASSAAVVLVLAGALLLVVVGAPVAVSADNCAGLVDCFGTAFGAALAGAALPFAMAAALGKSAYGGWRRWASEAKYNAKTERAVLGVRG